MNKKPAGRTWLSASAFVVALGCVAAASLAVPASSLSVRDNQTGALAAQSVDEGEVSSLPNIVVILTDDQRARTERAMPVVAQELISRGVTYPNAVVPTSWCCPSRASLLTGLYSHNTGVWDNTTSVPYGAWPAFMRGGNESRTLAVALKRAGYRTGLFGKYLNGLEEAPKGYRPQGWDSFDAFSASGNGYTRFPTIDGVMHTDVYSTDYFAQRTVDFLAQAPPSEPVFAVFAPFAPHSPFIAGPYEGAGRPYLKEMLNHVGWPGPTVNERDVSDRPEWVAKWPTSSRMSTKTPHTIRQAIAAQLDTLMGVDAAVASILATLEDTGRLHNTLIVYVSDNGYSWGEHRLRGKNTPHRAATEVPLVLRWDAKLPSGIEDDRLVAANIDVTATILEAAGTSLGDIDGTSVLGAPGRYGVTLEAAPWRGDKRRPAYCGWRAKDAMFVRYATGEEEVYEYAEDPYEEVNRATDPSYTAEVTAMRSISRRACLPRPPDFSWRASHGAKKPSTKVAPVPKAGAGQGPERTVTVPD